MFFFLFLFLFFAILDDLCDNDDGNLATICEFRSELPSSNPVHLTLLGGLLVCVVKHTHFLLASH